MHWSAVALYGKVTPAEATAVRRVVWTSDA